MKTAGVCLLIYLTVSISGCTNSHSRLTTQTSPKVQLKGLEFEYVIGEYEIRLNFEQENQIRWTYLKAPRKQTGNSGLQQINRTDIRPGIILMAWDEADGTRVIDILDLEKKVLHANFVLPDAKRFFMKANITRVQ